MKLREFVVKNKVLHVQLLPLLSGVQNVSISEIDGLKGEFNFEMVCSQNGPLVDVLLENKIEVKIVKSLVREINVRKDIEAFFDLRKVIKDGEYDIVHTHSSKPGFIGRLAAKTLGVKKIIHTVHGFSFSSTNSKIKKTVYFIMEFIAARFTDYILVMNRSDEKFCTGKLKIPKEKVIFLQNGVNDKLFNLTSEAVKEKLKTKNEKFKLAFVGRLWAQKNPILLILALDKVIKKTSREVELTFIGDGELRSELEILIDQKKLGANVKFLGWVNDAATIISNYDAFVLPSDYEGMPLSIIESMAAGTVVIASKISGNNDLIQHGVNGLLFERGSASELASNIIKLIDNPYLAEKLIVEAYKVAYENYRASVHCDRLAKIYKN